VIAVATGHTPVPTSEYFLRVRYDLTEATAWHPVGMPVAWDEIPLPWGKGVPASPTAADSPASFSESGNLITLKAKDVIPFSLIK
jgi:hypothetical protein